MLYMVIYALYESCAIVCFIAMAHVGNVFTNGVNGKVNKLSKPLIDHDWRGQNALTRLKHPRFMRNGSKTAGKHGELCPT